MFKIISIPCGHVIMSADRNYIFVHSKQKIIPPGHKGLKTTVAEVEVSLQKFVPLCTNMSIIEGEKEASFILQPVTFKSEKAAETFVSKTFGPLLGE